MRPLKSDRICGLLVFVLVLPLAVGGCRREPWGGCPFEDRETMPDFVTPWGTTLEQDIAQLDGSYRGTFAWRDGEEVIAVPRAGDEIEAEAIVEVDPTTARMRVYESTEETPVCELDYLFMEATVSFVRVDDGRVELTTSVTIERTTESSVFRGSTELMPVPQLAEDLVPQQDFDTEGISTEMWWGVDGEFRTEYYYVGQSMDSSTTGHGVSKLVAEFFTPDVE